MEDSILKSIKPLVNVVVEDDSFNASLIPHINSAISRLHQLGIGQDPGFEIDSDEAKWSEYLPNASKDIISAVKTNIALNVRLVFDPPQTAHLLTALEKQIEQSDWRINVMREETDWVDPEPPVVEVQNE